VGFRLTGGRAPGSIVLVFRSAGALVSHLLNVFVQDEISIVPRRVIATFGTKVEHNDFTGVEFQPTARLRWSPSERLDLCGAPLCHAPYGCPPASTAIYDSRARSSGGGAAGQPGLSCRKQWWPVTPGIDHRVANRLALDVAVFVNGYDDLRTRNPRRRQVGFRSRWPITFRPPRAAWNLRWIIVPAPFWQLHGAYTRLSEDFQLTAASRDPSKGSGEHNDPRDQFSFRSYIDLPARGGNRRPVQVRRRLPQPKSRPAIPSSRSASVGGHGGPMELSFDWR
jgi:iron complex outermembrane receptor protein